MGSQGWRKTMAVTVTGLALVAGGGVALAASEQDGGSSFLDAVARHLGVSSEQLESAAKAAALEQVETALGDGKISEEEAAELRSRIESGDGARLLGPGFGRYGPGFGRHYGMGMGLGGHWLGYGGDPTAMTAYLGLTAEELRSRLRGGESLAAIAEAQGKSVDGLKQTMLDATRQRLDEAVAAGRLSREQADALLERMEQRIAGVVEGTFRGWRGGRGGPHFGGPPPGMPGPSGPGTSERGAVSPETNAL